MIKKRIEYMTAFLCEDMAELVRGGQLHFGGRRTEAELRNMGGVKHGDSYIIENNLTEAFGEFIIEPSIFMTPKTVDHKGVKYDLVLSRRFRGDIVYVYLKEGVSRKYYVRYNKTNNVNMYNVNASRNDIYYTRRAVFNTWNEAIKTQPNEALIAMAAEVSAIDKEIELQKPVKQKPKRMVLK